MPQTTLDDSSWAIVRQLQPRSLSNPAAPSRPIPVIKAATPGLGQFFAKTAEEHVDRRTITDTPRLDRVMQPAILTHDEMIIGARKQNFTGDRPMALDNKCHSPVRLIREPLSQPGGKRRIDMLDDDDRGLKCRREDA